MNKKVRIILAVVALATAAVVGFIDFAFIGAMTPVMQAGTTPLQCAGILLGTLAFTAGFVFFLVVTYKLLTNKNENTRSKTR